MADTVLNPWHVLTDLNPQENLVWQDSNPITIFIFQMEPATENVSNLPEVIWVVNGRTCIQGDATGILNIQFFVLNRCIEDPEIRFSQI